MFHFRDQMRIKMKPNQREDLVCDNAEGPPPLLWLLKDSQRKVNMKKKFDNLILNLTFNYHGSNIHIIIGIARARKSCGKEAVHV